MSVGNLRVPKGIEKGDALVVVRNGNKIIQKKKFRDIPIVLA